MLQIGDEMKKINVMRLRQELDEAGIKNSGCNELGVVWGEDGTTEIQNTKAVKKVISQHDPDRPVTGDSLEEKIAELENKYSDLLEKYNGLAGIEE
jgi:DnaJ-domain-containing protein 1